MLIEPTWQHNALSETAFVDVHPAWLPRQECAELIARLQQDLIWESRSVTLFGKTLPQPRLISWVGSVSYKYSGLELPPRALIKNLKKILIHVVNGV